MKYVRTPGFLIDLRRLPDEHRKLFVQAVHEILRPALDNVTQIACLAYRRNEMPGKPMRDFLSCISC
jgi:hypothetical protein